MKRGRRPDRDGIGRQADKLIGAPDAILASTVKSRRLSLAIVISGATVREEAHTLGSVRRGKQFEKFSRLRIRTTTGCWILTAGTKVRALAFKDADHKTQLKAFG
ncbi:hypothetical protein Msil_2761 [Methylocella silvestris BL2]|uniref:Uncharacterized protein n=1 Tax=Methylocella silvestris (strain DSM 15510 / CIP 108128 / LMG 27833 / NCIMB 13906 / BL2) TaxID=395965 RepID=B8ERY4_METSB|nr:hypothetical protein Msil_2761 [Methylocella silvestris BL2]